MASRCGIAVATYFYIVGNVTRIVYGHRELADFLNSLGCVEYMKIYRYRKRYRGKVYEYERVVWWIKKVVADEGRRIVFSIHRYVPRWRTLIEEVLIRLTPTPTRFVEKLKKLLGRRVVDFVERYVDEWGISYGRLVRYLSAIKGGIRGFWKAVYSYVLNIVGIERPTKDDLYRHVYRFKRWVRKQMIEEGIDLYTKLGI